VRNPCADTDNLPTIERPEMAIINPDQTHELSAAMFDITTERLSNNVPGTRAGSAEFEAVAERFARFVLLGAFSGLRFGELAGLRARRIDVRRRELGVESNVIEVRGQLIEGPPRPPPASAACRSPSASSDDAAPRDSMAIPPQQRLLLRLRLAVEPLEVPRLEGLEWTIRQGFRVGDASDRLARAGPDLACASRLPPVASADEDVGLFGAVNLVDVDPGRAPR